MSISLLPFGAFISNSGTVVSATSGTTSGFTYGLNFPALNISVQTNVTGSFSGTVNVQLIGSLDNVNYFPIASGLFSGGSSNVLSTISLTGPIQYIGTQITNFSGAGAGGNTLTTYIWAK